jgi:hypothetical protein
MKATFFASSAELRKWFEEHQQRDRTLDYYYKERWKVSITWAESVDDFMFRLD